MPTWSSACAVAAESATTILAVTDSRSAAPSRALGCYDIVVGLFCGLLLISNIAATKPIQFGPELMLGPVQLLPIVADGGAFLFPLTYILGDVLAEVYGLRRARRTIFIGFGLAALMSLCFLVVGAAPAAASWPNQEAWSTVLGFVWRISLASLLGYLAGQLLNAWVLVKIRERTGEKALWARLLGSTVVGELADTAIFCTVAFAGVMTGAELLNYTVVGFVYKVLVEVCLLPITYLVIRTVRRRERLAHPDGAVA
ncbi:MAG TPA: queuosine precursor transporter [Candidatus Avipropionibacterium avicola]|uniref:Probable queuosine precursor transporter n=1 Tax=Candidatus Avipropionibacterium avicola TaxID=2840701 RepID=A0A9D1GYM0_9ACTN|nr:queuosine precursor transporter [Candidatus Avipropionibacterium avicola]